MRSIWSRTIRLTIRLTAWNDAFRRRLAWNPFFGRLGGLEWGYPCTEILLVQFFARIPDAIERIVVVRSVVRSVVAWTSSFLLRIPFVCRSFGVLWAFPCLHLRSPWSFCSLGSPNERFVRFWSDFSGLESPPDSGLVSFAFPALRTASTAIKGANTLSDSR